MITKGQHNLTPYVASVDEEEIKEIKEKVSKVNRCYDKLKKNVNIATCKLIQKIELCCNRLTEKIAKRKN